MRGRDLLRMSRELRHRGPDDEGFLVVTSAERAIFSGEDTPRTVLESQTSYAPREKLEAGWNSPTGGVALGHRRLSIVDLSPHGHQPMSYRDRYWIVFNGEIYNHPELREELIGLGHGFSSHSDTEVILAAYAEWGPACLSRFNGMWGFAIYDCVAGTLFLARDRFGVKPLYYRWKNGQFAFASEIKAFATLDDWTAKADRQQFLDFLVWSVIDHTSDTLFAEIKQVAGGHFLLLPTAKFLSASGAAFEKPGLQPTRWYELPRADASLIAPTDAVAELRSTLQDAVRLRLRADVPVGSCLSGGLDSSAIVCLMSRQLGAMGIAGHLKTFTAGSADRAFDESDYAREVVKASGADGHFVTPDPEILFENLDRLIWHQDTPLISASTVAQWMIFREARKQNVVVMLDGQGADEILCGYRGFFGAYLASLMRGGRYIRWWEEIRALRQHSDFSWLRSLGYTAAYLQPGAVGWLGKFDKRAYSDRGWVAPGCRHAYVADPIRRLGGRAGSIHEMSTAQVTATNLPMLLHWEDRNSMASSVEARVPFLDFRVVELCLRMEDASKVGGGISKAVLRQSMRGIVPDRVLDRRDKMGFVAAEPLWMKRDRTAEFRRELVGAVEALRDIVDPSLLPRFDEMLAGKRAFDHRYWRVISAARWARIFAVKFS